MLIFNSGQPAPFPVTNQALAGWQATATRASAHLKTETADTSSDAQIAALEVQWLVTNATEDIRTLLQNEPDTAAVKPTNAISRNDLVKYRGVFWEFSNIVKYGGKEGEQASCRNSLERIAEEMRENLIMRLKAEESSVFIEAAIHL